MPRALTLTTISPGSRNLECFDRPSSKSWITGVVRPLHTRQAHLVVTLELQVKQVVWAVLEELDADALAEG